MDGTTRVVMTPVSSAVMGILARLSLTAALAYAFALAACGQSGVQTGPDGSGDVPAALDGFTDQDGGVVHLDAKVADGLDIPTPHGPVLVSGDTPWEVTLTVWLEEETVFAQALGDQVLVQRADGSCSWIDGKGTDSDAADAPGTLLAAVRLEEGTALVAGTDGLAAWVDGGFSPSPLDGLGEERIFHQLARGAPGELWLAAQDGLWLHRQGVLYGVEPEGLPTLDGHIAHGAPVDGTPCLWVASGDAVYALAPENDGLVVAAWLEGITATALATDGQDRLWVVAEGDLYVREPNATWTWYRLPEPVTSVMTDPTTGHVWLGVGSGVWHHGSDVFGPLDPAVKGALLGVDEHGMALVSSDGSLVRVLVGEEPPPPPPPTWEEDIEPLSVEHCGLCHGPGAAAHPMFTRGQWISDIEEKGLIAKVTAGQMPLPPNPPLDAGTMQRIVDWQAAGYPE